MFIQQIIKLSFIILTEQCSVLNDYVNACFPYCKKKEAAFFMRKEDSKRKALQKTWKYYSFKKAIK